MNEPTNHAPEAAVRLPEPRGEPYTDGHDGQRGPPVNAAATPGLADAGSSARGHLRQTDWVVVTLLSALLTGVVFGFVTIGGQLVELQEATGEVRTEVADLRTEMHKEISGLRTEMQKEIGDLRTEIATVSERVGRIETTLQIHHGPLPPASD